MKNEETDKKVLELLQKIEDKKNQIGNAERPSWRTNCAFTFNPDGNERANLQVIKDLSALVEIFSFLKLRYETYMAALSKLKIAESEAPFKWLNFRLEDWMADIETRINQLRIKSKKDELAKLEARVNALISPEQRREIELAKLMKEIE